MFSLDKGHLMEIVSYPNGGKSFFYCLDDMVVIVDEGICERSEYVFPYSMITDKQNAYVNRYSKVYRCLAGEEEDLYRFINDDHSKDDIKYRTLDRSDYLEASALEMKFEDAFANAYGMEALRYLQKEYPILGNDGSNFFLDYAIASKDEKFGVEENGVSYHHPQIIGIDRYRKQLYKQNTCTKWGIKLYRFSSEDCAFENRIEDDIVRYFGNDINRFDDNGIVANRSFKLYEHQELTLKDIDEQRKNGIKSFLAVLPTASGKSQIVLEDLKRINQKGYKVLILAPSRVIVDDWLKRIEQNDMDIDVMTYSNMARHYHEYDQEYYNYIVVDEAHHSVAPILKKVIQYFTPDFLIGLTATDQRMDKQKLEDIFGSYKTRLSLVEAMDKGIIAKANVYRLETNIDLSEVRFNGKDYTNADIEKRIRVTSRNELIANVLEEYFNDGNLKTKQGVIFCVNVNHAKEMEKTLKARGISAAAFFGSMNYPEKVMDNFRSSKIRFLCSCNMISEGWDYPELGILVMARPTLSKVLYLQQIGRGLRKTINKENVFIIDVVDEYGPMVKPCSMHSIFKNMMYVPFGEITKKNYILGEYIEVDGLVERIEKIVQVDINTFEDEYGNYLNQEQLAREYYFSTGTITSWIKNKRITPDAQFMFGSRKIYLFSPDSVEKIRIDNNIPIHNEETIYDDFFAFLEERDYSLSYKIHFLLSFIKNLDNSGDADIEKVLDDYIAFYQDRVDKGLVVDRKTCPYNNETLKDRKMIKNSMLVNPFEKFERKRFLYYSKDLGKISINHALYSRLTADDYKKIINQMNDDLVDYYSKL